MSPTPSTPVLECVPLDGASTEAALASLDQGEAALEPGPGHQSEESLAALEEALHGDDPPAGITVVVGRHGLVRGTLAAWAERRGLPIVAAGPRATRGDLGPAPEPSGPLAVLPSLEACFLRHTEGLAAVRRVLDLAADAPEARLVVGCNRWAWRFLDRVTGLAGLAGRVAILHLRPLPEGEGAGVMPARAAILEDPVANALLYDLLLHEELSREDLVEISPYPRARAGNVLGALRRQGLVGGSTAGLFLVPAQVPGVVTTLRLRGWIAHG